MLRHLPLLLRSFLVAWLVGSTVEVAAAQSDIQAAWQSFQSKHGFDWSVTWNRATGTPRSIVGPGLPVSPAGLSPSRAEAAAKDVVRRFAALLSVDPADCAMRLAVRQRDLFVFQFTQYAAGLEVIGARVDVRLHASGVLAMMGSRAVRIPSGFSTSPSISSRAAVDSVHRQRHLGVPDGRESVRLVIWADVEGALPAIPRLAWEVTFHRLERSLGGRVYVDAHTGRDIAFENDVHGVAPDVHGKLEGWVNLGLRFADAPRLVSMANVQITAPGFQPTFTDEQGRFTLVGPASVAQVTASLAGRHAIVRDGQLPTVSVSHKINGRGTLTFSGPSPSENEKAQVTGYLLTDYINRWVQGIVPAFRHQLDGLLVDTNLPGPCNAFFHSGTGSISFFESSAGCSNSCFSTVIFHEWGHALDHAFGGISTLEGLSEGWSDTLAAFATGQPFIAEGLQGGTWLRTVDNAQTYPPPCSPAHCAGQTFSGFNWGVRRRFMQRYGNELGARLAEAIVLGSIVANATHQPDAVLEMFLLDDDDGNLTNGTPNYLDLAAEAEARNYPYPRIRLFDVQHVPLAATDRPYVPRMVYASVTAQLGRVARVLLHASNGQPLPVLTMVEGPGRDEFRALLPGQASPSDVSYHFTIEHESGASERYPESGEFQYFTGVERRIFFDDCEGGNVAWIHRALTGQDDWMRDRPNILNQNPYDPRRAYSGTSCWGNDLAPLGFNGNYEPNVENYLRSPTFDTRGHMGVTLRYRRWLSVQEGPFDRAEILASGQTVWRSPGGPNTKPMLDREWTLHEVRMPQGDHQASFWFEFHLTSDAFEQYGGWNVDDVELYSRTGAPDPALVFETDPAHLSIGGHTRVTFRGTPGALLVAAMSLRPGGFSIPGIGTFEIDPTAQIFQVTTLPAGGILSQSLGVPNEPGLIGAELHAQALAFDGIGFTLSNPQRFLFGS